MEISRSDTAQLDDAAVLRVAALIEQRADEIADRMIAAYRERIPSYAAATPESRDDAREWARASVVVVAGIVTGKMKAQDFEEALTDVGRRRAEQGYPLRDVLMANLIATEILWNTVRDLEPEDEREQLVIHEVFMTASISLLQHAVTGLSAGYLEIEEARVADEEHDMQVLVETLAGLRPMDRRHEHRAESRRIDLPSLRWCAVGRTEGDTGDQVRLLRRMRPEAAVGRVGRRVVAFFPGDTPPNLITAPAGIARSDDGAIAYRRACAALQVAVHLNKPVVSYEEVVPLALVLAGPQEDRDVFVEAQLGPLIRDPLGAELTRSLDAFYRSGQSVAAASRDLFVHRHTLEYRLSRIEAALGKNIRDPDNRMLLELALALHRPEEKEKAP